MSVNIQSFINAFAKTKKESLVTLQIGARCQILSNVSDFPEFLKPIDKARLERMDRCFTSTKLSCPVPETQEVRRTIRSMKINTKHQ